MAHTRFGFLMLIACLVLFYNCSVSKRHYRKGYHIVWHNQVKHNQKPEKLQTTHLESPISNEIIADKLLPDNTNLLATASDDILSILKEFKIKKSLLPNDSCADVIIFRDGAELTVKVVEVFNGTVKYLPCNNLDGPLRVLNADKVFMVKYANGTKEVLQELAKTVPQQTYASNKNDSQVKKINGMAMASFICSVLGFLFITAILAMIFGIIAMNMHKKYPTRYKGMWMAKFGIVAGAIWLGLYLLSSV